MCHRPVAGGIARLHAGKDAAAKGEEIMNGSPVSAFARRSTSLCSFGAVLLCALAVVLMAPAAAHAQSAAAIDCAKDTATTIANGFIRDQTNAALQAVGKMYPIDDGSLSPDAYNAAKEAWRTLRDAAEANLATPRKLKGTREPLPTATVPERGSRMASRTKAL